MLCSHQQVFREWLRICAGGVDEQSCMGLGCWADVMTMHKIYTHIAARDKEKRKNAMKVFYAGLGKSK